MFGDRASPEIFGTKARLHSPRHFFWLAESHSNNKEHSMKGKIALVTGASGGLGTYVTQAFLEAGATVIGTSRKIQQSDFTAAGFNAIPGEISSRGGAQTIVDSVVARFRRLDVLAHTVGGFAGGQSVTDTDDATFQ